MDKEFHYYITYITARRAGFGANDAYIIAYSSQYTDDNKMIYEINQGSLEPYSNYISQTYDISKPQKELMHIYPVFHFLPGCLDELSCVSARRSDGKLHLLNTIPDSENSKSVLSEALNSGDPYRIGIATHVYADTFAHQNFVGADDGFNDMRGLLESLIPSVGHADAKNRPDAPSKSWEDTRLVPSLSKVSNNDRFLEAAGCIFDQYCAYLKTSNVKSLLLKDLANAISDSNEDQRIQNYRDLIGPEYIDYDKHDWLNKATDNAAAIAPYSGSVDTVPRSDAPLTWQAGYKTSHWFRFQEAVKAHQEYVLTKILRPIYSVMEQATW